MITSPGRRLMLTACLALAVQFTSTGFAAADELDDITKAGVIKVGIFEDFPPFSSAGPLFLGKDAVYLITLIFFTC